MTDQVLPSRCHFLILLICLGTSLFTLSCGKNSKRLESFTGEYHGIEKTGNSTGTGHANVSLNEEEKKKLNIQLVDYSISVFFDETHNFKIPDQVWVQSPPPPGLGCMVCPPNNPFLVRVNGSGTFGTNGTSLNFTVHEYRKYEGDDDFVFFFDRIYELSKTQ